jgi:hypothetical protein
MKQKDVQIGGRYAANVSGERTIVRIVSAAGSCYGGWKAVNEKTGREVRIRTAQRLLGEAPRKGE